MAAGIPFLEILAARPSHFRLAPHRGLCPKTRLPRTVWIRGLWCCAVLSRSVVSDSAAPWPVARHAAGRGAKAWLVGGLHSAPSRLSSTSAFLLSSRASSGAVFRGWGLINSSRTRFRVAAGPGAAHPVWECSRLLLFASASYRPT